MPGGKNPYASVSRAHYKVIDTGLEGHNQCTREKRRE
jgi:hypothetical protein